MILFLLKKQNDVVQNIIKEKRLFFNKPSNMCNIEFSQQATHSFLNCSDRKDFEFLYDMFSANIYEAIHSIVESEEIAEEILTNTFVTIRKQQFAYNQNYVGIFTLLLRIAIQLSYKENKDSNSKKLVYLKLGKKMGVAHKDKSG